MDFSCLICWKAPLGLWPLTKAVLISDGVLVGGIVEQNHKI